jgi:TPR repeat protein
MAASNSAEVEKLALGAGMKKGGAAKGELVLAMYELANCFRNGWGIKKDPAAAKQYYETAANLGDTDAMNEVAWCYTEGFGTKKDKVSKICRLSSLSMSRWPPFWGRGTSSSPVNVDSSKCSCDVDANRLLRKSYSLNLSHHARCPLRHDIPSIPPHCLGSILVFG